MICGINPKTGRCKKGEKLHPEKCTLSGKRCVYNRLTKKKSQDKKPQDKPKKILKKKSDPTAKVIEYCLDYQSKQEKIREISLG